MGDGIALSIFAVEWRLSDIIYIISGRMRLVDRNPESKQAEPD
jgi:hypothetical protein